MGLKDLFSRLWKGEEHRAVEREHEAAEMTPAERAFDEEDYEGRKSDTYVGTIHAGRSAEGAARDEFKS